MTKKMAIDKDPPTATTVGKAKLANDTKPIRKLDNARKSVTMTKRRSLVSLNATTMIIFDNCRDYFTYESTIYILSYASFDVILSADALL